MNAYQAVQNLRGMIGESAAAYWTDNDLLTSLNRSQVRLYMQLAQTPGDWFLTSKAVTFTSSIGSLPSDCAKPSFLIHPTTGDILRISMNPREQGQNPFPYYEGLNSSNQAFLYGDSLKVNMTYSGSLTLWYQKRNVNLHMGTAGTVYNGAMINEADLPAAWSTGFTLDTDQQRSNQADYYNGLWVDFTDSNSKTRRVEITDYSGYSGTVIVDTGEVLGDPATYGMITSLPEEAFDVWLGRAAFMALSKPGASIDKETVRWIYQDAKQAEDIYADWISTRINSNIHIQGR